MSFLFNGANKNRLREPALLNQILALSQERMEAVLATGMSKSSASIEASIGLQGLIYALLRKDRFFVVGVEFLFPDNVIN